MGFEKTTLKSCQYIEALAYRIAVAYKRLPSMQGQRLKSEVPVYETEWPTPFRLICKNETSFKYQTKRCVADEKPCIIAIQEINKEYQQRKTNQCNLKEGSARMPEQSPAEAMVKT